MSGIFSLLLRKLNLDEPHDFKIRDMQIAIPKDGVPSTEIRFLENFCACGYVYEKMQEGFDEFIRFLEKTSKAIKKDPKCNIEYIVHRTHTPYKDMLNKLGYDLTEKNFELYQFDKFEKDIDGHLSEYDDQATKKPDGIIKYLNEQTNKIKVLRNKVRKDKQDVKNAFDKYLAQVKYGMELRKKYGRLVYCFSDVKHKTLESCAYNEKWYRHKDDNKLTPETRAIINKMEQT